MVPHHAAGPSSPRGGAGANAAGRHGCAAAPRGRGRAVRRAIVTWGARRMRLAARAYRMLLRLLPPDMRGRDGAEIEALFVDGAEDARSRGLVPYVAFLAVSAWDVIRRAPYERWRRRGRRPATQEMLMRSFLGDLRFAVRSFGRQPGATALVVLTLALGVAANTAVFAIVDGLFVRPFPFRQ